MIYSLQILRAIAAMMVVLFHYATWHGPIFSDYTEFQNYLAAGNYGVNLFFIISGFVMYYVTPREIAPLKFIGRRIIRIIPLYWILLLTHKGLKSFSDLDTLKSMFFIPLSTDSAPFYGYATYTPGWTLNYEMFFYGLLFVSLFFKKYRYTVVMALFIFLHALFCYFTGTTLLNSFNPHTVSTVTLPYMAMIMNPLTLLFGIGIIMGYFYKKTEHCKSIYKIIIFTFSFIALLTFSDWSYFDGHGLRSSLYSLLLFIALLSLEKFIVANKIIYNISKPFVYLGTISYSIYLTHLLLIKREGVVMVEGMSPFLNLGLVLVAIIIISSISYYLLEKKLCNYLRKKLKL